MEYMLTEKDVEVMKSALYAHVRQCKEFIIFDNKVKTFTATEKSKIEEKIAIMEKLLVNM